MNDIPYLRNLRRQCYYQRTKGTKLDNGYPYGEHLQDCDICQAVEYIEQLQGYLVRANEEFVTAAKEIQDFNIVVKQLQDQLKEYQMIGLHGENLKLQARIDELESGIFVDDIVTSPKGIRRVTEEELKPFIDEMQSAIDKKYPKPTGKPPEEKK